MTPPPDYPQRYRIVGADVAKQSFWAAWFGFCRGLGYQLARSIFRGFR